MVAIRSNLIENTPINTTGNTTTNLEANLATIQSSLDQIEERIRGWSRFQNNKQFQGSSMEESRNSVKGLCLDGGWGCSMVHRNDNDVNWDNRNGRNGGNNDGEKDAVKVFDEMSSSRIIKHDGSVRDYYDAFVPFASKMGWNGWYGVSMFILGLEPEMCKKVSIFNPKTLYDAYCLALMRESTNKILRESCNKIVDSYSAGLGVNDCLRNDGIKSVNTMETNEVNKDTGKEEGNSSISVVNTSEFSVVNKVGKREQKREVENGVIDISIGLMGIRVMDCDDKGVEDICEENVEGAGMELDDNSCLGDIDEVCTKTGKVDEQMKSEDENKSVMSVDEFFGYDGTRENLESLDENGEKEGCNVEEMESHGVTGVTGGWIGGGELCKEDGKGKQLELSGVITNSFGLKVLGKICKEDVEVKEIQSKNSKEDDGNKNCLQNYNDTVKGGKLMDNGQVMCGNRGMAKVAWKPLVKLRMNGSIMEDADYVVIGINDFVLSENVSGVKHVFEDKAWSCIDKHDDYTMESRVGIDGNIADNLGIKEKGKDKDMESSGMIDSNFGLKALNEFCEENVEVWTVLKRSENNQEIYSNNIKIQRVVGEGRGSVKVDIWKWPRRKKTNGIYCQVKNNEWKFNIWRWPKGRKRKEECFSGVEMFLKLSFRLSLMFQMVNFSNVA
ncbi:hypothetical protein Tco_1289102 [Tanacetum coccineum]